MSTPPDRPSPASVEQVARQYRCRADGPHHYGDKCDGGRVQAPNAQFTRRCEVCAGTGLDAPALAAALAAERAARHRVIGGKDTGHECNIHNRPLVRLPCAAACHCPECLVIERDSEIAENDRLRDAMRDALDNCETCRDEPTPSRRCARCQTFAALLTPPEGRP